MPKITYENLVMQCINRKCKLDWTNEEFDRNYKGYKSYLKIISSCGHATVVQHTNFIYLNVGIICKHCKYVEIKIKTKTLNIPKNYHLQEFKGIKAFEYLLKDTFEFKIFGEGTLADFAIKPILEESNNYMPIQMKTTLCHNRFYTFHLTNKYIDMLILCFCFDGQRMWLIEGNSILHLKTNLTIGKKSSIYSKYECTPLELKSKLIDFYASKKYNKDLGELSFPISLYAQQENEFRQFRESQFPTLTFKYSTINNQVCDTVVNGKYKVQDKVLTSYIRKNKSLTFVVKMSRKRSSCNVAYKLGDNDFYFVFLKDKLSAYIFPEDVLYEKKIISDVDKDECGQRLLLYPYIEK
jgi:hypothetical protein